MVNAHDLLWGMRPSHLPADAPAWAASALDAGHPVVVRRALCLAGQVPVGVRGATREQRYAAVMPVSAVQRCVSPEALRETISPRDVPALKALNQLRPLLNGRAWGISGSAGFELASGIEALNARSDLDLILRTPAPVSRDEARALLALLDATVCPVDLQLQTPLGGVALREWAGTAPRVLLKSAGGARLVEAPWHE